MINYDYPNNSQDYIHRIGRTGRCSQTGTAFTLFTKENSPKASELIKVLTDSNQTINPKLYEMSSRGGGFGMRNNRGRRELIFFFLFFTVTLIQSESSQFAGPMQGGSGMGMMRKPLLGGYNRDQQTPRESYAGAGMKRSWGDSNTDRNSSSLSASQPPKRPYTSYESRSDPTKAAQSLYSVQSSPTTASYGANSASYTSPPPISTYVQSTSIYPSFPHMPMQAPTFLQYPPAIGAAAPPSFLSFPPPPLTTPK